MIACLAYTFVTEVYETAKEACLDSGGVRAALPRDVRKGSAFPARALFSTEATPIVLVLEAVLLPTKVAAHLRLPKPRACAPSWLVEVEPLPGFRVRVMERHSLSTHQAAEPQNQITDHSRRISSFW